MRKSSVAQLASPGQQRQMDYDQIAIDRYHNALELISKNETIRSRIDPLLTRNNIVRVPFHPTVEYLGVLVDGGRHYFPMDWLKELIVYLHQLRYNMIHLRLTDDQAFNLQLVSHRELANPSATSIDPNNKTDRGKFYTADELRELVAFAKEHDIDIIPEINVPGHAGAWTGIPNMTVPCALFICNKGYGIPLNIHHPQIKKILKDILGEVIDIFDNPPFLHLGGDEVNMAKDCFAEAGMQPFEYGSFERMLQEILAELGFPEDRVVRWEETPQLSNDFDASRPRPSFRAGDMEHYWHDPPGIRTGLGGMVMDSISKPPSKPFFVSRKLYMDTNHDSGAIQVYNSTVDNLQLDKGPAYFPLGVIAGAFELDPNTWVHRNVAARLIAVAMGAAQLDLNSTMEVLAFYNHTCRETLELDPVLCDLQGYTAATLYDYRNTWQLGQNLCRSSMCERLTKQVRTPSMRPKGNRRDRALQEANDYLWKTMNKPLFNKTLLMKQESDVLSRRHGRVQTGVILDLVNGMQPVNQTKALLQNYLAPLGISLLQLRLLDNNAFALQLDIVKGVGHSILVNTTNALLKASELASLVQLSQQLGIQAFPEISVSTNAGGWASSGIVVKCPATYCDEESDVLGPITVDVRRPDSLTILYAAIRELLFIFSSVNGTTAGNSTKNLLLHLGSDERQASDSCFQEEARSEGSSYSILADFEQELTRIMQEMVGFPVRNIVRWENAEKERYKDRTGDVTHYPSSYPFEPPRVRDNEPFFVTIDILAQSSIYEIYQNTLTLVKLEPLAVFLELRRLDRGTWRDYQMEMRLAAFLMATGSSIPEYEDESFEFLEQVSQTCQNLGYENCEVTRSWRLRQWFGQSESKPAYFIESKRVRDGICEELTDSRTQRKMRSEFLA